MKRLTSIKTGIVVVAWLVQASPLVAEPSPEERWREVQHKLAETRKSLQALDDQERSLLMTLSELDQSLVALQAQHARAQQALTESEQVAAALTQKLRTDEEKLTQVTRRLKTRLRAIYVLGEGAAVRAVTGAQSFEELAYRKRLLQKMSESDVQLVQEHRRVRAAVQAQQASQAARKQEIERSAQILREQQELIETVRAERTTALTRIETEKELSVRIVKELIEQQQKLSALFQPTSPRPKRGRRGRGVLRQGLMWPLRGTLIQRFGVTQEANSRAKIVSNGIHLQVPIGTPVRAAAGGKVAFVGWMRGFGQLVILDHAEGHHTLHAHLSEATVTRGQRIEQGELLGYSGDTESLNGPKLYFELREEGLPKNPIPYLR